MPFPLAFTGVSDEKSAVIHIGFFALAKVFFSLPSFKVFVFYFQKFNYDVLVWISMGQSCIGFTYPLEAIGLSLFPNLGGGQPLLL